MSIKVRQAMEETSLLTQTTLTHIVLPGAKQPPSTASQCYLMPAFSSSTLCINESTESLPGTSASTSVYFGCTATGVPALVNTMRGLVLGKFRAIRHRGK